MSSRTTAATPTSVGVRRRLKLLLFVVVLFMGWAVHAYIVQYGQISDRENQLRETDKQLAGAKAKSESLTQEITKLGDNEYIEQLARKELGMGFPGEKRIVVESSQP